MPILAANMDTICESEMAIAIGRLGGLGVVHRFLSVEEQAKQIKEIKKQNLLAAAAVGIKDYEEIILMSLCRHSITANSSFGWWGAWLNANSDKIIIAPKRWFSDPKADDTQIVPPRWIRI